MYLKWVYCLLIFGSVRAKDYTDEDLANFPKLFHLDDYDRCLSKDKAVYCIGDFELTPETTPHPLYESMKDRTNHFFSFNRTQIHRGYCITDRCKLKSNSTENFEKCVARYVRSYALTPSVVSATCTTREQMKDYAKRPIDKAERMFLYVISLILILNVIGTVYDVNASGKKLGILTAWSLPSNWRFLTKISSDDALSPIQGYRTILQWLIIFGHTGLLYFRIYSHNPEALENAHRLFLGDLMRNGTIITQTYIMIACFLTSYHLLSYAQKNNVTAKTVAKFIFKRVFRILPVFLLVVSFGATWWPRLSAGPQWSLVQSESEVCKRKFWYHVFFLNNLIDAQDNCMVQGWATTIDVQMYMFTVIFTVLTIKYRLRATKILSVMFLVTCFINIALSYINAWVPMLKIINPKDIRSQFKNHSTWVNLHISPWGNLPACLVGLFAAHVLSKKNAKKAKEEDRVEDEKTEKKNEYLSKSLQTFITHHLDIVCTICLLSWVLLGTKLDAVDSKVLLALYVGMERLVFSVLFGMAMIFVIGQNGSLRKFLGWRGWQALGRLVFSSLAVHWCVNVALLASRPTSVYASQLFVSLDWLGTVFYSYVIAVPVCLMFELPMRRIYETLFL